MDDDVDDCEDVVGPVLFLPLYQFQMYFLEASISISCRHQEEGTKRKTVMKMMMTLARELETNCFPFWVILSVVSSSLSSQNGIHSLVIHC